MLWFSAVADAEVGRVRDVDVHVAGSRQTDDMMSRDTSYDMMCQSNKFAVRNCSEWAVVRAGI